jgi:hypothetical protein
MAGATPRFFHTGGCATLARMETPAIRREVAPDGTVVLTAGRGAFRYRTPRAGVLDITIEGQDNGQFGTASLDEISLALRRERPLEIFVDASGATMPAVAVSRQWGQFLMLNRSDLSRVSVLVSSKSVELTIAIVQHLSQTGKLIQLYTDPEVFEARRSGSR